MSAATSRWSAFLASVEQRHAQILAEAREGCIQLFEACDDDLGPLTSAWHAMERRAMALQAKLQSTFDDKVEGLMEAEGMSDGAVQAQRRRGDTLADTLETERERTRVELYAEAGERIWARALAEHPGSVECPQCGAPAQAPVTTVSLNLPCAHCDAVVTFEPGARMRSVAHAAIPALVERRTWPERQAVVEAERALRDARGTPSPLVKALHDAHVAHLTRTLTLRSEMEGRPLDLAHELQGRMRAFRQQHGMG
jgi:hypothetical protein